MLLTQDKSLCESRQKIIVSRDAGTQRKHRANNPQQNIMSGITSWTEILFRRGLAAISF